MTNKNTLIAALILLFIFLFGGVTGAFVTHIVYRQSAPTPALPPLERGFPLLGGPGMQERTLERLTQSLDLSAEQQEQVRNILQESSLEFRQLHRDTRLRALALTEESVKAIRQHLTAEQQERFQILIDERIEQFRIRIHRQPGMGRGMPAPPPM